MSRVASQKMADLPRFTIPDWERFSDNRPPLEEESPAELVAGRYLPTPPPEPLGFNLELSEELNTSWDAASSSAEIADLEATGANIRPGQEWFWSEEWQEAEREAEADLKAGRFETFETDEDFLASLV